MEKLKAKHDHTLTDILKVLIFSLFLLIPGIMFLPSMLYFGFNHEANAPVKEVQVQENLKVDFNQRYYSNTNSTPVVLCGGVDCIYTNYTINLNGTMSTSSNNIAQRQSLELFKANHTYLVKCNVPSYMRLQQNFVGDNGNQQGCSVTNSTPLNRFKNYVDGHYSMYTVLNYSNTIIEIEDIVLKPMIFDLTDMGLENITNDEFNNLFNDNYYPYTESQEMILTVDGPTEQVVDITTQLEWNWEQIWQRPILSWTKYSILKQGLDAFTNVFGVLQTSYITNLIAYELIMVAIYIVIDIVISIFKWLTHLIGTK